MDFIKVGNLLRFSVTASAAQALFQMASAAGDPAQVASIRAASPEIQGVTLVVCVLFGVLAFSPLFLDRGNRRTGK